MAEARIEAVCGAPDGRAWAVRGALLGGVLDYDGQTQAGVPLVTRTGQWEGALDVMWRPWAPASWGEAWLTGGLLVNHRAIRGTPIAGGLDETSTALLLGVRWRSPALAASGWSFNAEAEARASLAHRLDVDYNGLLDDTTLRGGRKRVLVLRVIGTPADSPWSFALEWSGLSQPASRPEAVSRGGVPLPGTTVWQPKLTTRDVAVRVTRRF